MTLDDEEDPGELLTPREVEVLGLIVNGLSAKNAAERLELSPRTIERHVVNIRHKLNARNRAHLVTRAIALGEIELAPRRGKD